MSLSRETIDTLTNLGQLFIVLLVTIVIVGLLAVFGPKPNYVCVDGHEYEKNGNGVLIPHKYRNTYTVCTK